MVNVVAMMRQRCIELILFRRIVRFDGLRLDDDGCVAFLVVLAFVRDGTYHVARCHDTTGRYDKHNLFHS